MPLTQVCQQITELRSAHYSSCCQHRLAATKQLSFPCRLTGRAIFRRVLLAKHGKLVLIPRHKLSSSSSADELAAYVQQELEAAVGGSLEAYRC